MQGLTLFHFFSRTRLQSETIFDLSSRSIKEKAKGYIAKKCNRLSNKAIFLLLIFAADKGQVALF